MMKTIKLSEDDISTLSDHALALWCRLCWYALTRAIAGDDHWDTVTTNYLNNSEDDIRELADHGYVSFDTNSQEYTIKLLKYADLNPTKEDIDRQRKLHNERMKRYRRGKI